MNNIDRLLEKYWNAETTVQEERELKDYFNTDSIEDRHMGYKPMFRHFDLMASQVTTIGLPELEVEDVSETKVRQLNLVKWVTRVAAVASIVIAATFLFQNQNPAETSYVGKYTQFEDVEDPESAEEALEITKQALAFLSTNLNANKVAIQNDLKPVSKAKIFKN